METINLHQPDIDTNLVISKNTVYYFQFFSSLKIRCIITQSSDDEFPEFIENIKADPFVTFHFANEYSRQFVTLCCQNMCILVEINDEEKLMSVFREKFIHKNFFPSVSQRDISELSKYLDLRAVSIPNKKDQKNLFYDIGKIKEIFIPQFFTPEFTDDNNEWTLSKFLYLSFDPIIAYSIRRFYYPTAEYDDPQFFKILNPESAYREFQSEEFKIIHHIGAGNTGSISLGIHIETGFIVALKSMKSKSKQSSYEKKFHRLYRHPFILHCYGEYKSGSFIVLVTDYMCNGDLDEYCRDQSLDPTSKTKAIAEILCGIDYLHSVGVMHRDLKPENILISSDKDFIISDFDTAIRYTSDRNFGSVGTFYFMARELFVGDNASFQTDLYSFGIIIYELATGENPFENLSVQDAIERITEGKIQQLPSKCGTIAKLYKRCTEDLKNKRASSFYLFEMLFNEILFFANSNEEYIFDLYKKMKAMQEKFKSKKHFKRASSFYLFDGELYSMFNLAVMYHNGWGGIKRDYKLAYEWFLKSAALGHPASIYDIGNMYYRERGLPKDLKKAFDYYKQSADLNFIEGYNGLGLMYYNGQVPSKNTRYDPETNLPIDFDPPDYKKAFECYKYAAERGHSYALCNCGHGFFEGKYCNGKPDYEKAVYWYKRAVEVGNKDAEYNLGLIYLKGLVGDGPNKRSAYEMFIKSAAQKQPKATYEVARMLRDGEGTEQNFQKSADYYRKSVCLKDKQAMVDLAQLIIDGKVERKDYCDDPRNERDKDKIGLTLFVGNDEEESKNYDRKILINDAIELLRRATENGKPDNKAMVTLASLYREKAIELLSSAAEAGSEEAKAELEKLTNEQ